MCVCIQQQRRFQILFFFWLLSIDAWRKRESLNFSASYSAPFCTSPNLYFIFFYVMCVPGTPLVCRLSCVCVVYLVSSSFCTIFFFLFLVGDNFLCVVFGHSNVCFFSSLFLPSCRFVLYASPYFSPSSLIFILYLIMWSSSINIYIHIFIACVSVH
jgi:hypothetical protein